MISIHAHSDLPHAMRLRPTESRPGPDKIRAAKIWAAMTAFAVGACGGGSDGPTAPDPGEQEDAVPSVSLTGPAEGSTVKGTVELTADASDDRAVASVVFFVDETRVGADDDGSDGWAVSWNTTEVADGDHTLRARATDDGGQAATDQVSFTVANVDGSASELWSRRAFLPAGGRDRAVAFSIGDRGYVGTGQVEGVGYEDFWEYDPGEDAWTQKADFGGGVRSSMTAFTIGDKAYVGTGVSDGIHRRDFWEYDPGTNTWTEIAQFGGEGRTGAVSFSVGQKGYVATGNTDQGVGHKVDDLWEYDPVEDTWTRKADLPGPVRFEAVGFSIGDRGYLGTGATEPEIVDEQRLADFWEYDPATDAWTRKADYRGEARVWAAGFALNGKGYIGLGTSGAASTVGRLPDVWEYDPATDSWTRMEEDWLVSTRLAPVGFSVGDRGFFGTGWDGDAAQRDLWEFTPPEE